jgi:hypothetical protein
MKMPKPFGISPWIYIPGGIFLLWWFRYVLPAPIGDPIEKIYTSIMGYTYHSQAERQAMTAKVRQDLEDIRSGKKTLADTIRG